MEELEESLHSRQQVLEMLQQELNSADQQKQVHTHANIDITIDITIDMCIMCIKISCLSMKYKTFINVSVSPTIIKPL